MRVGAGGGDAEPFPGWSPVCLLSSEPCWPLASLTLCWAVLDSFPLEPGGVTVCRRDLILPLRFGGGLTGGDMAAGHSIQQVPALPAQEPSGHFHGSQWEWCTGALAGCSFTWCCLPQ